MTATSSSTLFNCSSIAQRPVAPLFTGPADFNRPCPPASSASKYWANPDIDP
ncbi:Uncharacterised protein [Mycobacterium tuberculosis]|nr:Uncharacterised protein [Mycobacterium tuberculosis]